MKNRVLLLSNLTLLMMLTFPAVGSLPTQQPPLPDFDKRQENPSKTALVPSAAQQAAEATLQSQVPNVRFSRDPLLGTPRHITAQRGFLTGAAGVGRGVSSPQLLAVPVSDPHRVIKAFLN